MVSAGGGVRVRLGFRAWSRRDLGREGGREVASTRGLDC